MATSSPRGTGDRELIDTGTSKRYVRRDANGRFTRDQVLVGRSGASDRRRSASTTAPQRPGDRADRRPTGR